jgi:4-amino-4-deoxy-L-arabinose transferase-like glycosyltransferase
MMHRTISDSEKTCSKNWIKDLCLLTLFIAILFGTMLGSRGFSVPDEGRYSEIPREMVERADYVTPYLNGIKYFEKPPLLYWLQAGSIKSFGLSEWSLRFPTALLALLGCLMTYAGARLLYNRQTGLLSAAILATNVLYFSMAHAITLDMTLSVILTGCLLAFIVGVEYPPGKQRRWFLWAMYAFSALAVLTKGLVGIVFPGMIIAIWIIACNQWRILKDLYIPSGIFIFLLITVPWHLLVQSANPEFFHFYFIEQHFERYFTMSAGRYKPNWFFIPIALLGFFPWVLFFIQAVYRELPRSWPALQTHKTGLFFILWVFLIFIFFSLSKSKLIPYILPIFPALAIITGRYLSNRIDVPITKGIRVGFRLLPICAILLAIALIYLPYTGGIPNLTLTHTVLRIVAATLLISTLITYIVYRRQSLRTSLIVLMMTFCTFLVSMVMAVPYVDTRSVKPLAAVLKPLLKTGDEVAVYELYYQDLPFYLRQKVTIVEWHNELDFGLRHQPEANEWMISYDTFWKRWDSPRRIFLVISQKRFEHVLKTNPQRKFHIIAETLDDVLVSNQKSSFQN